MRPLLIKMQGFGPFRDETTVDFSDVELIGLVGATGSGKSTILDAITFALFGRIARLDARVVAPVVNALSQEARVSFDFEVAGQTYTAVRIVRRQGEGASTREARLERGGESLAAKKDDVDAQVEQLLGMNFDRFTKVAFLPQGKFSAFLHDKPADRQKLLRTLLGLGMYEELGKRARAIKARATAQLEVLRPRLTEAGVTDAQIAELDGTAESLRLAQQQLRLHMAERARLAAEVSRLEKEADDFAILALAVASISIPPEVSTLGAQIDAADARVADAERRLAEANASFATSSMAVAEGPDRALLARWLETHDELETVASGITELEIGESGARGTLTQAQKAVDELEAELVELAAATQQAERVEADTSLALAASRPSGEIETALLAHAAVSELERRVATFRDAGAAAKADSEQAATELALVMADLTAAQSMVRDAEKAGHVAMLTESLKPGDECPVCQQIITDVPKHAGSLEIRAATAAVATAEVAVSGARSAEATTNQALAVSQARLASAEAELTEQRSVVDVLPAVPRLETELAERKALDASAADARTAAEAARAAERAMRASDVATSATRALTVASAEATRLEAALTAARGRRAGLLDALAEAPDRAEIEAQRAIAETLATELQVAQHCREATAETLGQARSKRLEASRQEESLRREFSDVRDRFVGIDPPSPQHESVLADWQSFAAWAASIRAPLEAHHQQAAAQVGSATVELAAADSRALELCGPVVEASDVAITELSIAELEPLLTRLHASAEAEADSARKRQAQLAKDRADVNELEESEEVHELLGNQLRSSGFEQWLLDEVVEGLVVSASERLFELSRGQYSIEVDGMVFWVRDHRNGDERRDARTLSGGETFLASLALALALADSIEEMAPDDTPPIECLFLDEGFGTLDPETLDVVASAIEELGASGRMVGVITHIRELAERMPVRFEVTKQATTSIVEKVFS